MVQWDLTLRHQQLQLRRQLRHGINITIRPLVAEVYLRILFLLLLLHHHHHHWTVLSCDGSYLFIFLRNSPVPPLSSTLYLRSGYVHTLPRGSAVAQGLVQIITITHLSQRVVL